MKNIQKLNKQLLCFKQLTLVRDRGMLKTEKQIRNINYVEKERANH